MGKGRQAPVKKSKRIDKAVRKIVRYIETYELNEDQLSCLLSTLGTLTDGAITQESVKVYWRATDDDDVNWFRVSVNAPFMAGL